MDYDFTYLLGLQNISVIYTVEISEKIFLLNQTLQNVTIDVLKTYIIVVYKR